MISLMNRMIMNIAKTLALADPNTTKLFQKYASAFFAILSSDFSSKRFIIIIICFLPVCIVPWLLLLWYLAYMIFLRGTYYGSKGDPHHYLNSVRDK